MRKLIFTVFLLGGFIFNPGAYADNSFMNEHCAFESIFPSKTLSSGHEIIGEIQRIEWSKDEKNILYTLRTEEGTQVIYNNRVFGTYLRVLDIKIVSETGEVVYVAQDFNEEYIFYKDSKLSELPYPEISHFVFSENGTEYAYSVPSKYKLNMDDVTVYHRTQTGKENKNGEFIVENGIEGNYIYGLIDGIYFFDNSLLYSTNILKDNKIQNLIYYKGEHIGPTDKSIFRIYNYSPLKVEKVLEFLGYQDEDRFTLLTINENITAVIVDSELQNFIYISDSNAHKFLNEYEEEAFEYWMIEENSLSQIRNGYGRKDIGFLYLDEIRKIGVNSKGRIYFTSSINRQNTDINKMGIYIEVCNNEMLHDYMQVKLEMNENKRLRAYIARIDLLVSKINETKKREVLERIDLIYETIVDQDVRKIVQYLRLSIHVDLK